MLALLVKESGIGRGRQCLVKKGRIFLCAKKMDIGYWAGKGHGGKRGETPVKSTTPEGPKGPYKGISLGKLRRSIEEGKGKKASGRDGSP